MPNGPESDPAARPTRSTELLLEQLSSEYKILQDKIDKIGAFKFTIRGWTITIVVASCIGATTARLPSPWILLGLVVFVLVFGRMEMIQTRYRETFARRCAEIERWIWRLLREHDAHVPGMVPRIAHDLADETRAALSRWKDRPRMRGLAHAWRSDHEYVFGGILVVVILALTAWLAAHPKTPERSELPQVIQYNMVNPELSAAGQPTPKAEDRRQTKTNAQSKKTQKP
jgi:hypothetical protein